MDTWDTDQRTDKERFFDGLYSIPKLDSDDILETSAATLLLAASRDQRNIIPSLARRRPRASSVKSGTPTTPAITRASTMPTPRSKKMESVAPQPYASLLPPTLPLLRSSPPPDSSRILSSSAVSGKAEKRKRVTKPAPQKKQIFKDLYFYFIPNDLKNPARKFRVQKTDERGGFCLNEWREKNITHVIVDAQLKYGDVLRYLKKEKIPDHIAVVNEIFIGDCLDFNRIVNSDQPQYKVPGHVSSSPAPSLQPPDSITSLAPSLQIDPPGSRGTPHNTQDFSTPHSMQSRKSEIPSEETRIIPAAAITGISSATPDQRLLDRLSPKALTTPNVYAPALAPTSEQRMLEELSSETTAATTPGVAGPAPPPASEQRALLGLMGETNRPKDDLDHMIEEALKMGDLPSLDDDELENKQSADTQDTSSEEESLGRAKRVKLASKRTRAEKAGGWQETFQCMQKNDGKQGEGNPNTRTIEVLSEMQKYYEMTKDQWRSISYRKAINTLKKQEKKIVFASEARQLAHIGPSLAEKIEEIVRTDHLQKLDYAKLDPADVALKLFLGIYGVGPSLAHQWVQTGYKTLEDIKTKVKLSESQRIGVDHYEDFNCRIPREEVKRHGDTVMRIAALIDPALELEVLGSYRRGVKDCGDIDIMITKEGVDARWLSGLLDELVEKLFAVGFLKCGLTTLRGRDDGSKWHGASKLLGVPQWRRIDLLVVPCDERGAALLYFTGNDIFNRSMRLLASKKGYGLNQRGLFKDVMRGPRREKLTEGTKVEGRDEKRIFEILGVPYRTPEERVC